MTKMGLLESLFKQKDLMSLEDVKLRCSVRCEMIKDELEDEELLKAFIVGSKSVERAKERLDRYYTAKTNNPFSFSPENRDPKLINWNQVVDFALLPGLTAEGYHVILYKVPQGKEQMEEFSLLETSKVFFMLYDIFIKSHPITSGQIFALDCKGMTMEYLTKYITTQTTNIFNIYQNALPVRMKNFICFNASPVTELFVNNVLKYFLNEKLSKRISIHSEDHSVLTKYFSEDMLPQDLGGKAPTFKQIFMDNRNTLEKERDWLMGDGCVGSNEALRPKSKSEIDKDKIQGTFRKLELD